ncbi:hypothetical protein [Streptomyces sp. NPDC004286]|uniref:DNA polymerase Y family protein n=1 Tax=Streptomyces sp. NPDC004286 TaxID=3364696 RepID=UPI00369DB364
MTTTSTTRGAARRPRSILRVHCHLEDHPEPDTRFEQLLDLAAAITPVCQPYPADYSADLDITGALRHFDRTPRELAVLLQLRVIALHGVHTTIGGGRSPMLATMALAATPQGKVTVIDPDDTAVTAFLHPRPLTALPGIGTATARTLGRFGILTIGQLADTPTAALTRILGAHAARQLNARAHGTDDRPVQHTALVRSTSATHAFARDELAPQAHLGALTALADQLGARLRTAGDTCRGLTLTIRLADRSTLTRSRTLPEPTGHSPALRATAYTLYTSLRLERARVRALTLRADALHTAEDAHHQLLLDPADDNRRRLERATDAARARFGAHVVTTAAGLPFQP